jgi:ferric enterobactin receptor
MRPSPPSPLASFIRPRQVSIIRAYFTQVNDVIKHIQTVPVDDVVYTIAENLNRAINTGLEFIGNFHPVRFWDFTANVNVFERINDGDSAFGISATQGLSWNVNLTNNFSLARNLALQVRADYKASELIIQDRYRPTCGVDGALRYDFWHRKASLTFTYHFGDSGSGGRARKGAEVQEGKRIENR